MVGRKPPFYTPSEWQLLSCKNIDPKEQENKIKEKNNNNNSQDHIGISRKALIL
jgi:hypothetical protein